jgi:predicted RNA-binding protein YlqC (UPF0109 family)
MLVILIRSFMAASQDQEFVDYVVKTMVANPSDVKVDRTIDERGVLLTLAINPADMGTMIGKDGRTAKALRTLLRVVGAKNNARVNLKILEPEGSTRPLAPKSPRVAKSLDTDTTPLEEEKATEIV